MLELEKHIKYDRYGRMEYNPLFHCNSGSPWTNDELEYLILWYEIIGPEEMSFALERTIVSIMQKVNVLRQKGIMKKPERKIYSKRVKKNPLQRVQNQNR